jgi:hypothetical protein
MFRMIAERSGLGCLALVVLLPLGSLAAVVDVRIDAGKGRVPISPYIYGRNNCSSCNIKDMYWMTPEFYREAGLRISRESNGNNGTKYNWRRDLSSHPDWYNNVYPQGIQPRAAWMSRSFTGSQFLFGLPALGWVAKTDAYNYKEWEVKNPPRGTANMCGGGAATLYLEPWTAKDSVDMLDHWFGPGGLGMDPASFRYFHIDNEPECWLSTHDDVGKNIAAEEAVRKYAAVAREMKRRFPGVRLMAPGFSSEWFWWNWGDQKPVGDKTWLEYFIKRMAEESKAFGKPLIDLVDFHTYVSGEIKDADLLQEWRIFYDPKYQYPRANGCRIWPTGQWDDKQKVECLFGRTEEMLNRYFGPGHGIGIAITEAGPGKRAPMVGELWYADMLGTYADHEVEVFCPWEWNESWWEVLHLFSRYSRPVRVETVSGDPEIVSAYASVDAAGKWTVIFTNRDPANPRTVQATVSGKAVCAGKARILTLAGLKSGERTFFSHSRNAIREGSTGVKSGRFTVELPPYSITAVVLDSMAKDAGGCE